MISWHMNATQGGVNLHPGVNLLPGANLHTGANCAHEHGFRIKGEYYDYLYYVFAHRGKTVIPRFASCYKWEFLRTNCWQLHILETMLSLMISPRDLVKGPRPSAVGRPTFTKSNMPGDIVSICQLQSCFLFCKNNVKLWVMGEKVCLVILQIRACNVLMFHILDIGLLAIWLFEKISLYRNETKQQFIPSYFAKSRLYAGLYPHSACTSAISLTQQENVRNVKKFECKRENRLTIVRKLTMSMLSLF